MRVRTAPTIAGLVLLAVTSGCTGSSDSTDRAKPSAPPVDDCRAAVERGPLPAWARGGFTPADQSIPHVVGAKGDIVGVLFGYPLSTPRDSGRSNKILWVSRPDVLTGSSLEIHASLDGTTVVADREVDGGPGPSTIDLPQPGCWTLELRWSGHTDAVRLDYVDG